MSARREIEFPWADGETIRSRPTLLKLSQIETKWGAAQALLQRIGTPEMNTTSEFLPLLVIILRGCEGVPKTDAKLAEAAFDLGLLQFIMPAIDWIVAAYTVDNPPEPKDDAGGN